MLTTKPFYFNSIRNITAAFGTLFNNIYIQRFNTDGTESIIKVPLAYTSADKTIIMLQQQDAQRRENQIDVKISLPRMSFMNTGITYDSSRKTQTTIKNVHIPPADMSFNSATAVNITDNTISIPSHNLSTGRSVTYNNGGGTSIGGLTSTTTYYVVRISNSLIKLATTRANALAGTVIDLSSVGVGTQTLSYSYSTQYNAVPYNFEFSVYIFVKYIDDGLQIIEQVLPYFTPTYALTTKDSGHLEIKRDVPITLTSVTQEDIFEGAVEDERIIQWTLTFNASGWIYPPIVEGKVIKKAYTNIFDFETEEKVVGFLSEVDPEDANFDDDWDIANSRT